MCLCYVHWGVLCVQLLMPLYPGQMYQIRKNLFHAVYIIDPASPASAKVQYLSQC